MNGGRLPRPRDQARGSPPQHSPPVLVTGLHRGGGRKIRRPGPLDRKAHLARTAAAQRMREYRARQAIGATRIALDLDGDDVDWLRSQGTLAEWDEQDARALAQALKLTLQKLRRKLRRNEA